MNYECENTYCMPMQALDPFEKLTMYLSFAFASGPIQCSGVKVMGDGKASGLRFTNHMEHEITV